MSKIESLGKIDIVNHKLKEIDFLASRKVIISDPVTIWKIQTQSDIWLIMNIEFINCLDLRIRDKVFMFTTPEVNDKVCGNTFSVKSRKSYLEIVKVTEDEEELVELNGYIDLTIQDPLLSIIQLY